MNADAAEWIEKAEGDFFQLRTSPQNGTADQTNLEIDNWQLTIQQ